MEEAHSQAGGPSPGRAVGKSMGASERIPACKGEGDAQDWPGRGQVKQET